ncbi:hypothetical protein BCY84_16741 [Trypanosoma cruzi cruzi]|nr:hypothetical protein BCY84_16741 [Trypanosoma cruzi cruzi]
MPKAFKVRNEASRIAIVEFLVDKRVRFLEYLCSLHQDEVLWMGTVRLTRSDVVRSFRGSGNSHGEWGGTTEYRLRSTESIDMQTSFASGNEHTEDVVVSVGPVAGVPYTVPASWLATRMPCYVCLAMSLADILHIPLSVFDFVDCVYAMLLEMDVRFASGATAKALAQRNLRSHRQQHHFQQHTAFSTESMSFFGGEHSNSTGNTNSGGVMMGAVGGGFFTMGATDVETSVKYLYLNLEHRAYMTPAEVRYEEVIIPLCSLLKLTYRRLGDYDVARNEESVKRILSIDRRLQHMFFSAISKELGKIARGKLLQQTLLLSTSGLFVGLGGSTHDNTTCLLRGLLGLSAGAVVPAMAAARSSTTSGSVKRGMPDMFLVDSEEELEEEEGEDDEV